MKSQNKASHIFFVLVFSTCSVFSQNIDSLKTLLSKASHDTVRIRLLNVLTESAPDEEWPAFNKQMLELAEKKLKTEPANTFYLKYLAGALNNTGLLYQNQGDIPMALEYSRRSLATYEQLKDKTGIAYASNNLGFLYFNLGDIPQALEYQHRALKIQEEAGNKFGIASALNFIAQIYQGQGQDLKALECYNRSLRINEEIKNASGVALSLNNIGYIHQHRKEFNKALDHLSKAALLYKELNNADGYATTLLNMGINYKMLGNTKQALDHFSTALKIEESINFKKGTIAPLHNISSLLFENHKLKEAEKFSLKELETARQLGYPQYISDAAFLLKNIYQQEKNFTRALEMSDVYILYRDSVTNEGNRKVTFKKQLQYAFEKKATADSVKTAEEKKVKDAEIKAGQAQLAQEKTTRYALFGGLVLVLIFLGLLFNRFKTIQKQKSIIEAQKTEVELQKETVVQKQKEILDSIYYAKRIQTALLTPERFIDRALNKLNNKK